MDVLVSPTKIPRALHTCSCGGISYSGQSKGLILYGKRKAYLCCTYNVNLSITMLNEVRHIEESQQVKKLKNLKSIVLLGDKNSPMGSTLKRKDTLLS